MISTEQEALIGRVFDIYLTEHHCEDILQHVADTQDDDARHHSVVVNAMTLFEANMEVGDYFNAYPNHILAIFDEVLQRKAMVLTKTASPSHRMRKTFHTRVTGLPVCPELTRHTIPRSRDVGHFLSVTGTVIRTSVTKVLEYERDYMCTKCKHVFKLQADFDQFYTFVPPVGCPNPVGCNSYKFSCLSGGSEPASCRDYQEIKIQEQVQRLSVGSIPRSLVVVLGDDLVDSCKSGDDVTVYGVMCLRWKPFSDGVRCDVELVLKANYIEVNNQQAAASLFVKDAQKEFEEFWESYKSDPLAGRNQILLSLCPQVFGMYVIKLAVAMVLAGGVQRTDSSGTKIRGECHMLLVGDPGTGKSQFLKYAAKIISRSVLTAGIGSTSAGLTVAAVKDGGDWHLEAGALVLSDGGLCCIDEFNSIKEHDRISIHEAMEQQSISVAKAGMVCKLNTRTSILAATNPKGQYDSSEPLSVNVALASPLLSRFDLVLVLRDTRNAEWDRIISSFILEDRAFVGPPVESSALWSMEKMKAYFSVIKQLQPQMSEQAKWILTRYYQLQRQRDGRNAARTTIRMLESLSRLAEAHARLMFRETVTIDDAITAVSVMECSMQGGALLGNVNALLTSFPADPVQQYQTQCQILLEGLQLPELLQSETDRLDRLRNTEAFTFDPLAAHQHLTSSTDSKTICNSSDAVTVQSGSDTLNPISPPPSPIITSTQENLHRKSDCGWPNRSVCHTEEESDSFMHVSVISALEQERNCNNNKHVKEKIPQSQEKTQHSEIQEEESNSEPSGSEFQKSSKNLREKRVQQPVLDHQQSDGGLGRWHRGKTVCQQAARTTDILSDYHPDRTMSDSDKLSEKEGRGDLTGTKNKPAVRPKKMAAEAESEMDLHAKFSAFLFKPKKMRLSDQSISASSEHSARKNNQAQDVPGVCVGDVGGNGTSERLQVFPFNKDKALLKSPISEKKTCTGEQRSNTITGQTLSSSINSDMSTCGPGPFKPDRVRPVVSASTIAKLSRFSFSSTTEPAASVTASQTNLDCFRANSAVQEAPSSPKRQTRTSLLPTGNMDEGLLRLTPAAEHQQQGTKSSEFPVGNTVNLRKRKCFHLSPPNSHDSKPLLSGQSLFGSTDLFHDVLDTDWDQEVLKTAKV
ncbi:DNA helicase MCM9 isoform X2 [Kryptolebias marmoratus]|uniref:DNA helicase MCM9 isoform X2 n=1 Tax=Kryptolebias marmoratus TaxID=37003 RepID=UPI000D52F55A|nr:DNA helicase MCM9 isoform X2 [Kryptolebias marmoratus]